MTTQIDLDAVRERLAQATGRTYWRSLDELADTEAFHSFLDREFPRQAQAMDGGMDRRTFVKLMGASLALAGLSGCQFAQRQPQEKIVPYVRMPENVIPGKPLFYATTVTHGGFGYGVVAETHEGRPTKLEGNPDHPATLGASDIFIQASILTLYDPDRSTTVLNKGAASDYNAFKAAITAALNAKRGNAGTGLAILTETVTSPTLADQLTKLTAALPQARWYTFDADGQDNARAGAALAFGSPVNTLYAFDKAEVVVALDGDIFSEGPGALAYSRAFSRRRRALKELEQFNRLYAVESSMTLTGAMADHRVRTRPATVAAIARAIAAKVGASVAEGAEPAFAEPEEKFINAVAKDLGERRGRSIVVAGQHQTPAVHALAHAINAALGNVGQTVTYTDPIEANPQPTTNTLAALTSAIDGGQVDTLVIFGANPVYSAPADVPFAAALAKVATSVHVGLYADETAKASSWHVNMAHDLEEWGDARAYDGTVSVAQPTLAPLWGGKSAVEIAALLNGQETTSYNAVRAYWQAQGGATFEADWAKLIQTGAVPNTVAAAATPTLAAGFDRREEAAAASGLDIVIRPDPSVGDGRWANNGWLQELPKHLTKLTWDNAALISVATAKRLALQNGDVVNLSAGGRSVKAPIWILPGSTDDVVTVHLGYGRSTGNLATGLGFSAYALRTAASPGFIGGGEIAKTGERHQLVTTQDMGATQDREPVVVGTIEAYKKSPATFAHKEAHELIHLYPAKVWEGVQWGMSVDLSACTGCNACVVACNAENNIAVVGKDQVSRGRYMHWIRIDRYFESEGGDNTKVDTDNVKVLHQPLMCQHCENAPCESVCPVAATVHSADGLNQMTYNRCVGTKYCSNNCPYKVRRFNFLQYSDETTVVRGMAYNPNVTVRSRGVMEKCTFCVQRIATARQDAERTGTTLKDGDVVTACQQACPTEAIVFGNINDPQSKVAQLKAEKLNYALLELLNTRPRTTYLAKLTNPNPELAEA